jgi:hypothetical protein
MRRTLPLMTAILRLCLALSVALVSAQTAIGRAEARGATGIEICVGVEIAVITLDASGKPLDSHYSCPDCVLSGLALTATAAQTTPPATTVSRATPAAPGQTVAVAVPPPAAARGPPGAPVRA